MLCKKAITVNAAQLGEIRSPARERGRVLEEAMTLCHMPLYRELRERVKQGAIGRVNLIQVNFESYKPYGVNNRFFSPALAGGRFA